MRIDFSHHAYCFEGDAISLKESLVDILERELKFKTKGNPDFWLGEFNTFGINDGKQITDFQLGKAMMGGKKVMLITLNSITREAQNSLLKTLEDPVLNTHFFLVVPSAEILLPTLKSRMVIIPRSDLGEASPRSDLGEKFLSTPKKERLEIIKEMAENKDKAGAIELLNQLERVLYEQSHPLSTEKARILKTINKFRGYLNDRSPNLKMILEYVALITP
jgi:DNA polymerase III delta prime subunit